jgi:glyoxylase-like metal-dependent hydrolase (beta-lactamase superfamily II)
VRALALHPDVLVVTSALLQANCVIVRGGVGEGARAATGRAATGAVGEGAEAQSPVESFVIDSPVLPDELDALPALIEQAGFPPPSGMLATHGDWDHLLGRLAFPGVALGVAESTAGRLAGEPGVAQRELRSFDEDLLIERVRPLALGSLQALPVPGHCAVGDRDLELHPAEGHTQDGMAIAVSWAGVLVVGDYLSTLELPRLCGGGRLGVYVATLERLRRLVADAEHVVPGHGALLDGDRARAVLEEDVAYLASLRERGEEAELPPGRRATAHRRVHLENAIAIAGESKLRTDARTRWP